MRLCTESKFFIFSSMVISLVSNRTWGRSFVPPLLTEDRVFLKSFFDSDPSFRGANELVLLPSRGGSKKDLSLVAALRNELDD